MKTLVIHPEDPTTDFLKLIYEGKGFTVMNKDLSRGKVMAQIMCHDRIIMLGHGCPTGLFGGGSGFDSLVINPKTVQFLRDKECIAIWCNADQFMNKYRLNGFFTGMFISEVAEADMFDVETTQDAIDGSNTAFATIVGDNIDNPNLRSIVYEKYDSMGLIPVVEYNRDRLYQRRRLEPIALIEDRIK